MAQGTCTVGQLVDPGMNVASLSVPLIAPNTEFGDRINQLDLNVSKTIKVGRFSIQPKIDLFNALNRVAGLRGARAELRHRVVPAASVDSRRTGVPAWRDREVLRAASGVVSRESSRRCIAAAALSAASSTEPSLRTQAGELVEQSSAVAELLRRHAEEVQQRELQVGQRRVFRIDEVTAALERARASAHQQRRAADRACGGRCC